MKFDIERSIIYDTINYFDIYFNKQIRKNEYELSGTLEYDSFKFYDKIKLSSSIDYEFYALFYRKQNQQNMLKRFFLNNLDIILSVNDFCDLLIKEIFYENIYENYLVLNKDYKKQIFESKYNNNLKISLMLLFSNYGDYIQNFCKLFKEIHSIINQIFLDYQDTVNNFSLTASEIKVIEGYTTVSYEKDIDEFFITFLLPYDLNIRRYPNKFYTFFGIDVHKTIKNDTIYKYNHIRFESTIDILSNDYAIIILNIIYEYKEINPSKLIDIMAEKYNCCSSTIYRILSYMTNEKMINVSKKEKNKSYYAIDTNYFKKAAIELSNQLMFEDKEEYHSYMNFINSILLPCEGYKKIIELLSNDYALPILNIIKEYNQVNSSKIIDIMSNRYKCANSTIYRIITLLLDNNVIYVSKRSANKIYYSINEAYFINAEREMSNLLLYYINKTNTKSCVQSHFN